MANDKLDLNDLDENDFELNDDLNDDLGQEDTAWGDDQDEQEDGFDDGFEEEMEHDELHDPDEFETDELQAGEEDLESETSSNEVNKPAGNKQLLVAAVLAAIGVTGYYFGAPAMGLNLPLTYQGFAPAQVTHVPTPVMTMEQLQAQQQVPVHASIAEPSLTDAVDSVVVDNVESLEEVTQTLELAEGELKSQQVSQDQLLETLEARLAALEESKTDAGADDRDMISEQQSELRGVITSLEKAQEQNRTRLEGIRTQISEINGRMTQANDMMLLMASRIDDIESRVKLNAVYVDQQLHQEELVAKAEAAGMKLDDIPEGKEWILDTKVELVELDPISVADTDEAGLWRLKGYQIVSWSPDGDEVQIRTYKGDKFLFKRGERISSAVYGAHTVKGIDQDGQRMLIGDKYFIDTRYVNLPHKDVAAASRLELDRMARFGYIQRLKARQQAEKAKQADQAKAKTVAEKSDEKDAKKSTAPAVKDKKPSYVADYWVIGNGQNGAIVKTTQLDQPYVIVKPGDTLPGIGEVTAITDNGEVVLGNKRIRSSIK